MRIPMKSGAELLAEIAGRDASQTPVLWWLGHCSFAVKFFDIVFYLDPALSPDPGRTTASPLDPAAVTSADMILCTHAHPRHLDPATLRPMLEASPRAKVVLPKSAGDPAHAAGIGYDRMTTTDSGLRIEYFKNGVYARIYAVPSAHTQLDKTPLGGYPYLGYLVRCGAHTIYHAGDCVPYEGLADSLRPYNVTVALLPIEGPQAGTFTPEEAAQLAQEIGARWLVPMHYGAFSQDDPSQRFLDHMLFHRPSQRFKIFQCGEGWQIPPE